MVIAFFCLPRWRPRRVLIHPIEDSQGNMGVRFQHPAPVELGALGNMGWREEDNLRQQALEAAGISAPAGPLPPVAGPGAAAAAKPAMQVRPVVRPPSTPGVASCAALGSGPDGHVGSLRAPTQVAQAANGHAANGAVANGSGKGYTMAEVEKHNTAESCWFVHEGKVRGRAWPSRWGGGGAWPPAC